ncbi:MAG: flavin-containing monooxygenase [Candidatus Dormibacteraceae bacterium]
MKTVQRFETVIVGGGQAGLSTAYELTHRGVDCIVLEAEPRIGNQWRRRWDSLRLFTPARFDRLPGSRFPADDMTFPTKDELADYLESYTAAASLPVRRGVKAISLTRAEGGYQLYTSAGPCEADHVVIATGYDKPKLPDFAKNVSPTVKQLHAFDYRNPDQLIGDVLVVGAGTSGVEIAIEAAQSKHATTLAGRSTGAVPPAAYAFGGRVFWFYANRIASLDNPIGRAMRPQVVRRGAPLIRLKMADATAAGVARASRVMSVEDGLPVFEDGMRARADTIVWCTGFGHDYSWIHLPIVVEDGLPRHRRGVVEAEPGLYFVGLVFQSRLASGFLGGVGMDARFVAETIGDRVRKSGAVGRPGVGHIFDELVEIGPGHAGTVPPASSSNS